MGDEEMQIEVEIIDDGSTLPGEDTTVPSGAEFALAELLGEPIEDEDSPEVEEFYKNLADDMDEGTLNSIAGDLLEAFDGDTASRKDWLQTYIDGLELLGLRIEQRTEPWSGACGVFHPLLSEALVKFQAETIMETFPPSGPVKTTIIGKETPEKKKASVNVAADMNFQLTEVMTEYRPEHERMLWGLGLSGNAFKKVYYDPALERQISLYVPAEDLVVPYGASNLDTAERVTHVMRKSKNEVIKLQANGFYRDIDLGEPTRGNLDEVEKKIAENMGFSATSDDRFKILEIHVDLDLSEYDEKDPEADSEETEMGGIALPYVVTIEKSTQTVLAIYRNWAPDDEKKLKREHFVHYPYIPGFGFYAFGLVHLLGSFAKSGTSLIRQLVDAGTLSNLPGGFKTRGMRIKGDDTPISPGEFRDVDVASGTIKDNIMTLPYKEPSQVLFTLMQNIVEEGRKFASTADLKISDMSAQSPVGTTLAILERTLKVMSSVHSRVHYAMKRELRLLASIIRDFTPDEYDYEPEEGSRKAKKADYDMVDVIPVSDPNASTMAQKVTQWQAVMQLAQGAPQIYDLPELHRQMLDVLGVKNIGKIIPTEDDQKPTDPITENMRILAGKPVKAFMYQDHEAHIAAHMGMSEDPKFKELVTGTPAEATIMAAGAAHVAEHFGFLYRKNIEDQLGVPLPPPDETLPEEVEVQLSRMVAQAQAQLTQKNQAEAAQAQQQQEAQDPLNIIQREELELRKQEMQLKAQNQQAELQLKAQAQQADIQIQQAKLALETSKVDTQKQLEGAKISHAEREKYQDRMHQTTQKLNDQVAQTSQQAQNPTEESK
tara:strand:+ start:538 stop:3027 length:2490 start_codon:yes stop_codon:yes gene_type:complete